MNKKYIVSIVIVLIYAFSFLIWRHAYINVNNRNNILIKHLNEISIKNTLLEMDLLQNQTNSFCLNHDVVLYTDKNNTIHLSKIKPKGVTLVFRYSILGCTTCIDEAILKVKDFLSQNPDIKIITLATYTLPSDLRKFKRLNKEFKQIYHVESLDLPIEESGVPYFFLLDDEMKISNTFIIRKEFSDLTLEYLNIIKKTFRV